MAGKKKTVKDLNGDLKDLALKFKQFEEVLKGILKLEGIKYLDKKLAALDRNVDNEKRIKDLEEEVSRLTSVEKQFKENQNRNNHKNKKVENNEHLQKEHCCKSCNSIFESKQNLKLHVKEKHVREIKCNICEDIFDENFKL